MYAISWVTTFGETSRDFQLALDKNTHQGKLLYVRLVTGTFLGCVPLSPAGLVLPGTV